MGSEGSSTDQLFMDDLKKEFTATVAQNLIDMQKWLAENKFEEIERVAHDIKGTSGIFGLDEGTEIARELHIAARDREIEKTKLLIDKLTAYMKANGIA